MVGQELSSVARRSIGRRTRMMTMSRRVTKVATMTKQTDRMISIIAVSCPLAMTSIMIILKRKWNTISLETPL